MKKSVEIPIYLIVGLLSMTEENNHEQRDATHLRIGFKTFLIGMFVLVGITIPILIFSEKNNDKLQFINVDNHKQVVVQREEYEDEQAFLTALKVDTDSTYLDYIKKNKDGNYIEIAQSRIIEIEDKKLAIRNLDALKMKTQRNSSKDDSAFELAKRENSIQAYVDYLSKYPQGKYVQEAKSKIESFERQNKKSDIADKDDKFFLIAKKTNNKESYQDYLNSHPNGSHIIEAIENIQVLDEREKTAERISNILYGKNIGDQFNNSFIQSDIIFDKKTKNIENEWIREEVNSFNKAGFTLTIEPIDPLSREPHNLYVIIPFNQHKDFLIESKIIIEESPKAIGNGIVWGHSTDNKNFNYFLVTKNGYFCVGNNNEREKWENIEKKGDSNSYKLSILKLEKNIQYFINDSFVTEKPFEPFEGNYLGLHISKKTTLSMEYFIVIGSEKTE
jgi:hypothetical protein